MQNELTKHMEDSLRRQGADLVGFGDLSRLPAQTRCGLPVGISVAVKYPKEVIRGIAQLPTREYKDWYDKLNTRLDAIVAFGADLLGDMGYKAIAQTRQFVGNAEEALDSALPHKTVATRAGVGWIGKCALLVTGQYGSMIRLSSILTDAPLTTAEPVNQSRCGNCDVCTDACPAGAVSGRLWNSTMIREDFFDAFACRDTAHARSLRGFGGDHSLCGKCIEICPYTQRYIKAT